MKVFAVRIPFHLQIFLTQGMSQQLDTTMCNHCLKKYDFSLFPFNGATTANKRVYVNNDVIFFYFISICRCLQPRFFNKARFVIYKTLNIWDGTKYTYLTNRYFACTSVWRSSVEMCFFNGDQYTKIVGTISRGDMQSIFVKITNTGVEPLQNPQRIVFPFQMCIFNIPLKDKTKQSTSGHSITPLTLITVNGSGRNLGSFIASLSASISNVECW